MATPKQFLREYVKAIRDGNAAVFAGAGFYFLQKQPSRWSSTKPVACRKA